MTGILVVAALVSPASAEQFTIVALPDTQCYSAGINGGTPAMFTAQTNWIRQNLAPRNIKYVAHLGDVTQNQDDLTQWSNAKNSMSLLENAGVPFGTCVGNHDTHYGAGGAKDHLATNYVANFGPDAAYGSTGQTYADQPWYGGASPSGRSNYQVISAGGYEFLFMNLSIDCPPAETTWAEGILADHRDKPTVLSTHRYLYDFKMMAGYYGDDVTGRPIHDHAGLANESYYVEGDGTVRTTWPEDFAAGFVADNPNIFMVLSGHCHAQYHQTMTNANGKPVIEVLTDYQDGPAGGAGWLRTMDVDTETGEIQFETFSPVVARDRVLQDDFAETIGLISMYKEMLIPTLPGFEGTDPATPQGRAAIAGLISQFQADMDGSTNPEIEQLLGLLATMDSMDDAFRQSMPEYPIWQKYDEVRTYVTTWHPDGAAAWDADGDWDALWNQVFAGGQRDPSFTMTINFQDYVPEPATMTILAAVGLAMIRRRR